MGMPAARIGDFNTGHDCFPPTPSEGPGAKTVFITNRPVQLKGDLYKKHCCLVSCEDDDSGCIGKSLDGSKTVKIEGQEPNRIGDKVSDDSVIMTGCNSVIIGD